MSFSRDLVGGVIIILISGLLGVLQNSIRSRPMALVPRIPTAESKPNTTTETKAKKTQEQEPEPQASAAEVSTSDEPTADELSAGELSKERLKTLLEAGTIVLVDARSEHEFQEGHLPGAVNVPYEKFVDYYDNLVDYVPMGSFVVCYCRSVSCDLSDQLAQELKLMGYQTVMLYRGGWDEWTEAGYPVATE